MHDTRRTPNSQGVALSTPPPSPGMHWNGERYPSSRAPSVCLAIVPLTASASLNGVCNRQ